MSYTTHPNTHLPVTEEEKTATLLGPRTTFIGRLRQELNEKIASGEISERDAEQAGANLLALGLGFHELDKEEPLSWRDLNQEKYPLHGSES